MKKTIVSITHSYFSTDISGVTQEMLDSCSFQLLIVISPQNFFMIPYHQKIIDLFQLLIVISPQKIFNR